VSGENPDKDSYTLEFEGVPANVSAVRLEALTDPSLGNGGPGRTPHGNFVLTEISAVSGPVNAQQPVKFNRAEADFAQDQFPAPNAVDGNQRTGWAIQGPGMWNVSRAAVFYTGKPVEAGRWTVTLDQQYGGQHTLGHFRVSFGVLQSDGRPLEVRRRENLEQRFAAWDKAESAKAVHWVVAKPSALKTNLPKLTAQPDGSILAGGDMTKRDVYDLSFQPEKGIRALRLEVLPDSSLPRNGPGRVFYEGAFGDFHLSEITMSAGGKPVRLKGASQTFGAPAANALDGNPETGWSINGAQGKTSHAVFTLAQPLADGGDVAIEMVFERYFAAAVGRFRISFTTDDGAEARHPAEIEALLAKPHEQRSAAETAKLRDYYLTIAPELAPAREAISKLQGQLPDYPTTLVFRERPADNPRQTFVHKRGEFLQPTDPVQPGVLAVLNPMPADAPKNRLTFARWLVDPKNPLVARVAVNRQWAAIFGRGIVKTTEDFGLQGEPPSHPELLDYLACAFTASPTGGDKLGWSMKRLHRLIVTSATYRQSSRVTPELLAKDPLNKLLSRGPRFRMDAELIRDSALRESGLLSEKLGGPSVFPPQPPGVTSEGAYGALQWKVSEGEDRYRRGLYTFSKRTAPYAQFITFDAPSGEACVARRDVSNTPLQALTLMNDAVFVEANQALGKMVAARNGTPEERATYLFRRILTRKPTADELAAIVRFYRAQKTRLDAKSLNAAAIAGPGEGDAGEKAAWTLVARSVMNLDEAIVKE
jgi:hypothetical protein